MSRAGGTTVGIVAEGACSADSHPYPASRCWTGTPKNNISYNARNWHLQQMLCVSVVQTERLSVCFNPLTASCSKLLLFEGSSMAKCKALTGSAVKGLTNHRHLINAGRAYFVCLTCRLRDARTANVNSRQVCSMPRVAALHLQTRDCRSPACVYLVGARMTLTLIT